MIHFLRLIRFTNLFIIAATLYSIAAYLDVLFGQTAREWEVVFSASFFYLTLSTVFIAAAGNVINDYYDVEIDQVNRPEKVVVGRFISKQNTLRLYGLLNFFGALFMLLFVIQTHFYFGFVIAFFWIVMLWLYSSKFKKSFLTGNIIVALCIGIVPLLVGLYFQHHYKGIPLMETYPFSFSKTSFFSIKIGVGFGIFAFLSNVLREMVKDMEDIEGDQRLQARTIPIVLGQKKARNLGLSLWVGILVFLVVFFVFTHDFILDLSAFWPLLLSVVFLIYSGFVLTKATTKKNLHKVSLGLKLSMFFSLILPLYWLFKLM